MIINVKFYKIEEHIIDFKKKYCIVFIEMW